MSNPQVAALFVSRKGPYWDDPRCDCWDESRDARKYDGTLPVIAHPPCTNWSNLAPVVQARWGQLIGDDGGCFKSALDAVLRCGGVLEQPAFSRAWFAYGLPRAERGRWKFCHELERGFVTEMSQSA